MRRFILLTVVILLVLGCGLAFARSAGVFGFGPPPSYPEVREVVARFFALNLKDPDSVKGLEISRPVADCHGRGHPGKRAVCGYQFCVAVNAKNSFGGYTGRKVLVFWKYQGFDPVAYENFGMCPNDFIPWTGDPPVHVRDDFCTLQPKNADCLAGKRENYKDLSVEESVGAEMATDEETQLCDDAFKDKLRAKGMSYADIGEVCKN